MCELRTSRCTSWVYKWQGNQKSNCQHLLDHVKIKRITEKTSSFASLTMLKPLTVWITMNCGKFFKRWEYQTTLLGSSETCMWVKKQQLESDMEQLRVPNWENSAVATGLEKVSSHSNPKERHYQRMFKLLDICSHLTH